MPRIPIPARSLRRGLAAAALGSALASRMLLASPFVPGSDAEVLEELPAPAKGSARELRELRRDLLRDPRDARLATRLALHYLELGRAESDPRYFGWAEGVLLPWAESPEPPAEVLLLRATLLQNRHAFAAALADLDRVLARDPRTAQAWLTRAVIQQVQGDPAGALRSCLPLLRLAHPLVAVTCLAHAESLAGRAEPALRALQRVLDAHADAPAGERVFALGSLAEIAARTGRQQLADETLRAALELAPRDATLLAARADLLLDRGRPAEVLPLLAGETRSDGLLLRLALAEARLRSRELEAHLAELRARFAASRLRGDALHLGEEARFALELEGDAQEALRLAKENFAVQREPRDARILLEAALAAGDPAAGEPARALLRETSLEDLRLARLAARTRETR